MPKRYKIPPEVVTLCGDRWVGKPTTPHGVETLIARYEANGGDTVEVYVKADPGFCYLSKQINSKGEYYHTMISASAKLTLQLAHAASLGKDWYEVYGKNNSL
jgi:hypothetical protein